MPARALDQDRQSRPLLIAALKALDREGNTIAAAYVAMALSRVTSSKDNVQGPRA